MSAGGRSKTLTLDSLDPLIRDMRGGTEPSLTVKRAREIERELRKGIMKPFTEVYRADVGDLQAMSLKPITFTREVLTACTDPLLLSDPFIPSDVKARTNQILDECGGRSAGSYTYSEGIELIRLHVAQYVTRRDGFPTDRSAITLSSGSNEDLRSVLNVINCSQKQVRVGVLVPVPRDPALTALLEELGIVQIDYYLDEDYDWSIHPEELSVALEAADRYCIPKALLVVNPGNPTGSVLSPGNMEEVVRFAAQRRLVLLADEAYQLNAFAQGCPFQSFKKTLMQMGPPFSGGVELISFMAGSTCLIGQSCLPWGFNEFVNISEDVCNVYKKSICVKMCPGVLGQIALDCMICPPQPMEPSYDRFIQEWSEVMQSLNKKALILVKSLNEIPGVECSRQTAANCVYPKIYLPTRALEEAKKREMSPDTFYALSLLEETGICTQPGEVFGQLPGTHHLRLSMLPSIEKTEKMLEMIRQFHSYFMLKYG